MLLAELSYNLVWAAMAVYSCAMVAFAGTVAFGPRRVPVGSGSRDVDPAAEVAAASSGSAGSTVTLGRVTVAWDDDSAVPGKARRAGGIAASLTMLAFLLHLAAVVTRGFAAGRAPWGDMYEFTLTMALAATGAYLLLLRRYDVRFLGVVVVPVVLLALGLSLLVLYSPADDLVPALDSYWLVIHVAAAIVSAGGFTAGAALSGLFLARDRLERRTAAGRAPTGALAGWLSQLPPPRRLDTLAYRVHAFVFPLWTFAVVAGAIWAESAWGRYWGWDPKETWAFITWVVYAAYLHARATAGWRGGKASGLALIGYAAFLFNLFGVNIWFVGLHSYA